MRVISDAQGDKVVVSEDQTCAALLGRASNASPVVLAVSPVQEIINDQKWSFALALNVLETAFKKNHKKTFISTSHNELSISRKVLVKIT